MGKSDTNVLVLDNLNNLVPKNNVEKVTHVLLQGNT